MPRTDRDQWYAARTLRDLAELTARWLEGELTSQPGYEPSCGPDEETTALIPTLAAVNRAGYLTYGSQPGEVATGWDGAIWRQRAAVTGWTDPPMRDRLVSAAARADLIVLTNPVMRGRRRRRVVTPGVVVTTRAGLPYTQFGAQLSRRDVLYQFDECHPDAVAAVLAAEQVTVVDPVWARNDVLWPLLDRLTAHPTSHPTY